MRIRGLPLMGALRAGHWPTLLSAFLYFDASFMVWVMMGALANHIAADFDLTDAQQGLLVAVPILGGALLRLPLGLLADRIGGRRTGILGMLLTLAPLLLSWLGARSFGSLLSSGLLLGVAGASFAVALPLASRWYPARLQGIVLGIAGAGNSGTVLAALLGPRLAERVGWRGVFGLAAAVIAATLCAFALLARDAPRAAAPGRGPDARGLVRIWRERDLGWFSAFYSITFGGFVGLASFLGIFFHNAYGLGRVEAGSFSALCVVAGSFLRPVGGYLADRFGGIRVLTGLYVSIGAVLCSVSGMPFLGASTALLFLGMGLLGMGNGAVFQLVPQRFARDIGLVTGIVGAAGGLGGFLLPVLLGSLRQLTGSFSGGFLLFGLSAFACAGALLRVSRAWEVRFVGRGGLAPALAAIEGEADGE